MPKISEMRDSKFLKQSDVGAGVLVTISGCEEQNVALAGVDPQMKWCLTFNELDKPLVLNQTNAQMIAKIIGSDDTDDWIDSPTSFVLWADPSVSFRGEVVGGIRVRAKRVAPVAKGKPKPKAVVEEPPDLDDDDIPF